VTPLPSANWFDTDSAAYDIDGNLGAVNSQMQLFHRCYRLILTAVILTSSAAAADSPPDVKRLFPPGGQRDSVVTVQLKGAPGDGPLQFWTDKKQLVFEVADDRESAELTIPADAAAGVHWVRAYNEFGASEPVPFLVGLVDETTEVEPNNSPDEATSLESTAITVTGTLEKSGDVDVYRVSVAAGRTLVASIVANEILGSPMDSVIDILDHRGAVIVSNDDDHGMDSLATVEVRTDGEYWIRVYALPATPNSTIRLAGGGDYVYRLTVTSEAMISHTLPAVITAGSQQQVSVEGWNLSEQQRTATVAATNEAAASLDVATLPCHIAAVSHPSHTEHTQEQETPLLTLPSSATGTIREAGEVDEWRFAGSKGQKVTVSVDARSLHSLLDPVLRISDETGKVLKEADDRSKQDLDCTAAVTLPADGTYSVAISDRYDSGGHRHFYVLNCSEPEAEFHATVSASRYTIPAEGKLEIPVAIERSNGHKHELIIELDGLPEGCTSQPVTSTADGDTAKKVTLVIERDEGTFPGTQTPVRVTCTDREANVSSAATAELGSSGMTTTDIWLTVPAIEPASDSDDTTSEPDDAAPVP